MVLLLLGNSFLFLDYKSANKINFLFIKTFLELISDHISDQSHDGSAFLGFGLQEEKTCFASDQELTLCRRRRLLEFNDRQ